MKSVEIRITGVSPILMHRFPVEAIVGIDKKPKDEQAEIAAYRMPNGGNLYIPGANLWRSLVQAGTYSRHKGRTTLMKIIAAAVYITPEYLDLGTDSFEIDSRPVVIKATQGRIIRHRPMLEDWSVEFTLGYEETIVSEDQLRKVVDDAGMLVGVLDFRPEKKGPFGRFRVDKWN